MNIKEVRNLVKNGVLELTSENAEDARTAITRFVKRFKKQALSGEFKSRDIRLKLGFNTQNITIDGVPKQLQKIEQTAKGNNPNVNFGGKTRQEGLDVTTQPDIGTKVNPGSDIRKRTILLPFQEDHHIRFRTLFDPFYKGLSEADQRSLTKSLLESGIPIGNLSENLVGVDADLHRILDDSIHHWARENNIQVTQGKRGWTNFIKNKNGKLVGVRGGAKGATIGSTMNARMPDLSHMTNVNERSFALNEYIELINEPLENYTAETLAFQDRRRYKPGDSRIKTKEYYLNEFKNNRYDIRSQAELLDIDNPRYTDIDSTTGRVTRKFDPADLKRANLHLPYIVRKASEYAQRFADTKAGRVIGATTTGLVKTASKASAGIDPLQVGTGAIKAITANNPADQLLGAKDVVEGGLSTAAWFAPKLLNVVAPISTGSIVGGIQAGGAKRLREVTDDENFVSSFGTAQTIVNQTNPFEGLFKKKNDDEINEEETNLN
tara:strand:- start:63 stop:1541 length:1479 start_codon:yes stop_codon:yes gene_type:complete